MNRLSLHNWLNQYVNWKENKGVSVYVMFSISGHRMLCWKEIRGFWTSTNEDMANQKITKGQRLGMLSAREKDWVSCNWPIKKLLIILIRQT